jgi:membrane glycosyltransferase
MQIFYAAPFLLIAALLFGILSSIPAARRFAIIAPVGVIVFGPASLVGYFFFVLVRSKIWGHNFPADRWDKAAYVITGLIAAGLAIFVSRLILQLLPALFLRLIVFCGALCSFFVLISAASIGLNIYLNHNSNAQQSLPLEIAEVCTSLMVSTSAAWLISRSPDRFRPRLGSIPNPFRLGE